MIALPFFYKQKSRTPRQLRLPRPAHFILIRGAMEERIDAVYDESGRRMLRLVVHTRR